MRKRPIRHILFSLLLLTGLCFFNDGVAQNRQGQESSATSVELREFSEEKLEQYRNDSKFQYEPIREKQKGAFQRWLQRVQRWFMNLFGSGTARAIWAVVWRLVLIAAFILFIIKIFGIEATSLFKPAGKPKADVYSVDEESLEDIDFDEEIQKAVKSRQWRLAIRLTYLYSLKHMSDTGLITVKKGKTNHDYLYELSNGNVKDNFSRLSFLFDYTWYGHFEASENMASKSNEYLQTILTRKGGVS